MGESGQAQTDKQTDRQADSQTGEGCLDRNGLFRFREWELMRDFDRRCTRLSPQTPRLRGGVCASWFLWLLSTFVG